LEKRGRTRAELGLHSAKELATTHGGW
jgi:hypothetical protein